MNGAGVYFFLNEARSNLHQTAGISGCNERRAGRFDVRELGFEHGIGCIGLDEIVDAGAAAALIRVMKRNQLEPWYRRQHGKRRLTDALRVEEMTRRVVGDAHGEASSNPRAGRGEELTHVTHPS